MNIKMLCVSLLALSSLTGCGLAVGAIVPATGPSSQTQSSQTYKLYSWKDDSNSSYNYALFEASAADPDLARVRKESSADLSALLTRIKGLKAGSALQWNYQVSSVSSLHFMLPPKDVAQRIRDAASQQGLKLDVDPFFATAAETASR